MSGLGTSRTSALKIDKCLRQQSGSFCLYSRLLNGPYAQDRPVDETTCMAGLSDQEHSSNLYTFKLFDVFGCYLKDGNSGRLCKNY